MKRFNEDDKVTYTEDERLGLTLPDGIVAGDEGTVLALLSEGDEAPFYNVEFPTPPFGYAQVEEALLKAPAEYEAWLKEPVGSLTFDGDDLSVDEILARWRS